METATATTMTYREVITEAYRIVSSFEDETGIYEFAEFINRIPRTMVVGLARSTDTPAAVLSAMVEALDVEVLDGLAAYECAFVRECVARNPSTPAEVLSVLADDESLAMRVAVAENPNTPEDALVGLAADESLDQYGDVRKAVAENPSTPEDVREGLAADEHWAVRKCVAGNPSTPAEVLAGLATDEGLFVRQWVEANPAAPQWVRDLAALSAV